MLLDETHKSTFNKLASQLKFFHLYFPRLTLFLLFEYLVNQLNVISSALWAAFRYD